MYQAGILTPAKGVLPGVLRGQCYSPATPGGHLPRNPEVLFKLLDSGCTVLWVHQFGVRTPQPDVLNNFKIPLGVGGECIILIPEAVVQKPYLRPKPWLPA